jgi:predicted DNA-binding transcriptional regulator YafY
MDKSIIQAVQNQQLLRFNYDGGERVVEPHCYGQTSKGNDAIRAFQVRGYSSSGTLGWRLFKLSEATSIEVLEEAFENPRSDYKRGDKGMSVIYAEV